MAVGGRPIISNLNALGRAEVGSDLSEVHCKILLGGRVAAKIECELAIALIGCDLHTVLYAFNIEFDKLLAGQSFGHKIKNRTAHCFNHSALRVGFNDTVIIRAAQIVCRIVNNRPNLCAVDPQFDHVFHHFHMDRHTAQPVTRVVAHFQVPFGNVKIKVLGEAALPDIEVHIHVPDFARIVLERDWGFVPIVMLNNPVNFRKCRCAELVNDCVIGRCETINETSAAARRGKFGLIIGRCHLNKDIGFFGPCGVYTPSERLHRDVRALAVFGLAHEGPVFISNLKSRNFVAVFLHDQFRPGV